MSDDVRPTLVMIAGPNGSGKSTLTDRLRADGIAFGEYINADEIEKTQVGPDRRSRSKQAQTVADARRTRCVADRRSFSFETVMSHPSKVELLRTARALGFELVMYFVATADPEINVRRVHERAAARGPQRRGTRDPRALSAYSVASLQRGSGGRAQLRPRQHG